MSTTTQKLRIGVMGAGNISETSNTYKDAYRIGELIAENNCILICGGLGGVMEAAAKGAKQKGGLTIGILPGTSALDANPYIDIPILTGIGHARNVINIRTSNVIIAIAGGYGTLSEIALSLKCEVPVIGLNTWDLKKIGCDDKNFIPVNSPEEVIKKVLLIS